jgi:23S rRNA (adenine1618-N6)-methyltransferase
MIRPASKERMHARNRFRSGYDFRQLVAAHPALAPFVRPNPHGDASVDYGNPEAVKALNRALLQQAYGLDSWDVPPGYLCPPIPGRSDYLHHLADLLAGRAAIPRGRSVVVLDIGVGANCIYPLIGASEYGWRFVGSESDPVACHWARTLVTGNPRVADLIEIRQQPSATECFSGVIRPGEVFAASICNPPFYASAEEAAAGTRRRQRNLGGPRGASRAGNFGGQAGELWCEGGELGFIRRMIAQSAEIPDRCRWFTTLVSKSAHVPRLRDALRRANAADVKTIGMAQGQKQSRILAWTFLRA